MFENVPSPVVYFVGTLLLMGLSALLAVAVAKARVVVPQAVSELKTQMGADRWYVLMDIARVAVKAAQQARLNEWIDNTGEAAKAYALDAAKVFLKAQGLEEIDVDAIDKLIEGTYHEMSDILKEELEKQKPEAK
jgi:hypothetical protein